MRLPFTKMEKPEEDKWRVGVGEEEALCFRQNNFEMPIRNPNGNVDLDIQVWSLGERSRLEREIRSHQYVREYLKLRLDEITKGIGLGRKKKALRRSKIKRLGR